ncbi:MAG: hypothetical protein R3D63_14685 [Paracoccaceae bacterium]
MVMFAQTCFTRWPDDPRWLSAALRSYAENAPEGAMAVRRLGAGAGAAGLAGRGAAADAAAVAELRAVGADAGPRLRRWPRG